MINIFPFSCRSLVGLSIIILESIVSYLPYNPTSSTCLLLSTSPYYRFLSGGVTASFEVPKECNEEWVTQLALKKSALGS